MATNSVKDESIFVTFWGFYGSLNHILYKLECETSTIIVAQNQPFFNFASSNYCTSIAVFLWEMEQWMPIMPYMIHVYSCMYHGIRKQKQESSVSKLVYTICTLYTTRYFQRIA